METWRPCRYMCGRGFRLRWGGVRGIRVGVLRKSGDGWMGGMGCGNRWLLRDVYKGLRQ